MTIAELSAAGFSVSPREHELLSLFVTQLLLENERLNLTAIRTTERAWPLHVCDSLALRPLLAEWSCRRVIDVGTGGGVPGLPLACVAPDIHFVLIDATRKKIDAVRRIAAALGLNNVEAVWGRSEQLASSKPWRASADLVVSRAVAKLPELSGYSAGLLKAGAHAAFQKSLEGIDDEITSSRQIASRGGLRWIETRRYALPPPHGDRGIVIYRKSGAPSEETGDD
ncbi:MAG: 16S rRNA (guanine(527)-N(7))-methyltransferase RsmG [Planctomycetes bacterium]|nr:16S rRNA (guanine(527)-N(7))-methyltransferase RsmG [Planctomycetota bacterium]